VNLIEPALQWQPEFQAIRRDLHAHPELKFQEVRTAEVVATKLREWGYAVDCGLGGTGVVASLKVGSSTRAIGLRADMDALPLQEINTFEHRSLYDGRMHACGHDGHTTMLLAAAKVLMQRKQFDGTVNLIFQPAEEGGGGARRMIQEGLFKRFPCDAVFGLHNWPGSAAGTFGVTPGPMMASSNEFEIHVRGKGAHAALPHLGVDPVMIAVAIAQNLQTIVSRNCKPIDAAVLSITKINAGSALNIIADDARMAGTVRTFSVKVLDLIEARMREIIEHTATALGGTATLSFQRNYPPTINDPQMAAFCADVMTEIVGADHVDRAIEPTMGAEDFSYMLLEKPGSYAFIGNGEGGHREMGHGAGPCTLHNPSYDFNDEIIPIGASYWVRLAERFLAA
jgi:amidohydrolase